MIVIGLFDLLLESDFVFNNKDFPSLKIGDVVDVHERDTQNKWVSVRKLSSSFTLNLCFCSHLLLPVTQFHDDFNQKGTVFHTNCSNN